MSAQFITLLQLEGGRVNFLQYSMGGGGGGWGWSSETPKLYYVIYEQPLMQNYKQNRHPPEFGHPKAGTWQVRFPNCHIYFQRRLGNLTSTWQTTTKIIILVCKHSQQFPQLSTIGVFIWMHSTICVQNSNLFSCPWLSPVAVNRRSPLGGDFVFFFPS